jgi:hypothetical protein
MVSRLSHISAHTGNGSLLRRYAAGFVGLLAVGSLFVTIDAKAQNVTFRSNGGRWSRTYRAGWHRYWGGPAVGYYYAPLPVYVVPGYSRASYYSGPQYWHSNPSFGLGSSVGRRRERTYRYRDDYYGSTRRSYSARPNSHHARDPYYR